MEVRRRIQAGANAWINVKGVMVDRKISQKTEREGPGFMCGASQYQWLGDVSSVRTAST